MEATYPTLPDPKRVHAPLVLNRALQRVEPRVVQAPQPPVRRLVDRDLQVRRLQVSHAQTNRIKTVRTLSVFGERMRPNSFLKCSCTAAAISSSAWSGTIRTEICALTFDGITVESVPPHPSVSIATRRGGRRTTRPGDLNVVDRERGLAPARGEQRSRGLRHAREHLVQLPLVLRERTHAVVCED